MRAYTRTLFLLAAGLGFVNAAPAQRALTGCDVSHDVIPLPPGQTVLTVPPGVSPVYIAAGLGDQNYTCTNTSTYASIGAVAKLYDASCLYNEFANSASVDSAASVAASSASLLGEHYFIKNPVTGVGISPKFDFSSDSQQGDPNAYVVTKKIGSLPSPVDPVANIPWLELAAIPTPGDLAKYVFRIDTHAGQPPTTCTPGSPPITVPYAALYWFFK